MELLSCIPKQPKPRKTLNWGTWGRTGCNSSLKSYYDKDSTIRKSSTMPSRLSSLSISSSSVESSSPTSTALLRNHLLSKTSQRSKKLSRNDETYKTLFSIPESESTIDGYTSCPLKRSRTLPASAIRRSGSLNYSIDSSLNKGDHLATEAPSLRSLKEKFKMESFCKQFRNRSLNRKTHFKDTPPSVARISGQESLNSTTILYPQVIHFSQLKHYNCNSATGTQNNQDISESCMSYSISSATSNTTSNDGHISSKESQEQIYNLPDCDKETLSLPVECRNMTIKATKPESDKRSQNLYDTPLALNRISNASVNDVIDVSEDDSASDVSSIIVSPMNETSVELARISMCSQASPEMTNETNCNNIPREVRERGKRHSLASSASDGSRLTFGTSTDEGFSSNFSETSSTLWSSSATSPCTNLPACRSETYSTADESVSLYSSMSSASSCISSIYSNESSTCKGAIPKRRFNSFRHCEVKRSEVNGSREVSLVGTLRIDATEEDDAYSRCNWESDDQHHFNRSNGLRNPQQLPVTPTLLRILQLGLEQVGGVDPSAPKEVPTVSNGGVTRREKLHPPRTDAHRLSRANLEESGDLELDAILHELCALESQFNFEIASKPSSGTSNPPLAQTSQPPPKSNITPVSSIITNNTKNIGFNKMQPPHPPVTQHQQIIHRPKSHTRTGSGGMKPKFDSMNMNMDVEVPQNTIARTDSPDNDSAFSDNVSMLSSESSASSGASGGGGLSSRQQDTHRHVPTMDHAAKVKAEKIKMALEKLKEANVKKLFIKAFSHDGSSKSLLVDEKMTVAYVCRMLTDKNHVRVDPKWAIIEQLPDLYMERIYEDDEMLVDNLLQWTRESKNKLLFLERTDKYDLFLRPENYILYGSSQHKASEIDDEARNNLLEEFFSSSSVPEVEGPLFLKSEGKKAWKKFYFVLRQSGLYYCPKGRSSRSSKDLICLVTLEANQVYHGNGWKKKFKAPTDWGFAIKLPQLQTKSSKHIKYLCAEDANSLSQWVMGIRIAKHGQRLLDNYRSLVEDIAQEDIDMLASSRSFSLASVSASSRGHSEATTPSSESRSMDSCLAPSLTPSMLEDMDEIEDNSSSAGSSSQDTPVNTLSRTPAWRHESMRSGSSSSSSGCLSERSSSGTPTGEHGFESDFPQQGTIKRKPSSNPKIPLTSTTRHLVKEVDMDDCVAASTELSSSRNSTLRLSAVRKSITEEVNTLRRRNSSQSRSSVTSNVSSNLSSGITSSVPSVPSVPDEEDEVDSLPLPPPPLDLTSLCDASLLPPPPPELMASTLSLNSLPPPPEEGSLPSFSEDLMTASIISLPPPPPPPLSCLSNPQTLSQVLNSPPITPPKPKVSFSYQSDTTVPPVYHHQPVMTLSYQSTLSTHQPTMTLPYQPAVTQSYQPTTIPQYQQTMTPPYQQAMTPPFQSPTTPPYQTTIMPSYQPTTASHYQSAMTSTYQPPVTPPAVAPKPIRRESSLEGIYAIRGVVTSPTENRPPSVTSTNGWQSPSPPPPPLPISHPIYAQPQKSPQKKVKRITFQDDVQNIPPAPSPPCPSSPSKPPQPPRRLQSTKLSLHPGKLDSPGCKVTPPKTFLNNLQRVMQKKWQVAQKCRDFDKTPHEVLGFRDPFPQREAERNVGAWIQEHYGSLYENLAPNYGDPSAEITTLATPTECIHAPNDCPVPQSPVPGEGAAQNRISQTVSLRKKAPPPPPKRAETTHLSGIQ